MAKHWKRLCYPRLNFFRSKHRPFGVTIDISMPCRIQLSVVKPVKWHVTQITFQKLLSEPGVVTNIILFSWMKTIISGAQVLNSHVTGLLLLMNEHAEWLLFSFSGFLGYFTTIKLCTPLLLIEYQRVAYLPLSFFLHPPLGVEPLS